MNSRSASEMAELLIQEAVEREVGIDHPEDFGVAEELCLAFRRKAGLYREAIVLMVLLSEAHRSPTCEEILRAYEFLVLGGSEPTPMSSSKLHSLKQSMKDVAKLISPDEPRRELSWARSWLQSIGCEESNPARLALLAGFWMDYYIAMAKGLRGIHEKAASQ